jgi:hypothetical protein
MRFRIRIEMEVEVQTVGDAEAAISRAEHAAHKALGPEAAKTQGVLTRGELTPLDQAGHDALAADDLGPGIVSEMRSVSRPSPDR